MKKYFLFLTILIFFLCFNGFYNLIQAQTLPQEEDEKEGETVIGGTIETLKKTLKEVLVIWKEIHLKVMKYWKGNILPKIQGWYERKKPEIEEEFEKEKTEMKQEVKEILSNSWQWLKDLIK